MNAYHFFMDPSTKITSNRALAVEELAQSLQGCRTDKRHHSPVLLGSRLLLASFIVE
jgi:hypothetical protein